MPTEPLVCAECGRHDLGDEPDGRSASTSTTSLWRSAQTATEKSRRWLNDVRDIIIGPHLGSGDAEPGGSRFPGSAKHPLIASRFYPALIRR
jgi:hypothetical protein